MMTVKLPGKFLLDFRRDMFPYMLSHPHEEPKKVEHPALGEFSIRIVNRPARGYWTVEVNRQMADYLLYHALSRRQNGERFAPSAKAAEKRLLAAGVSPDSDTYRSSMREIVGEPRQHTGAKS